MSEDTEHGRRKLDGTVAGGIAWTAGAKSTTQLITWFSALIAARLLSPSDFGLASMAGLFTVIAGVLAEFGLGSAVLQMPELDEEAIQQLNTASVISGIAMWAIMALSAPLVAMFFKSSTVKLLVAINGVALFTTGFQAVPSALLQKDLDYRRLSIAEAVQALTQAVVTVVCAAIGLAYWSLVAGANAGRLAGALITYWWKPVKFRLPRFSKIRSALRLGTHVAVGRTALTTYAMSDGVIVGRMLGDQALGAYQWAMTVASAPAEKVATLVMRVTGPLFARIQNDAALVRRYFRVVSELLALTIFPMMFGLAVVAPESVQVLLGEKWMAAAGPIRWLALFLGVRTLSTLVSQVLTSLRYTRFTMWISLVSFVVMPAAFVVATRWGATAVAASWIILAPVTILPLVIKLLRAIDMRYRDYLGILGPALIGSAVMAAAVLVLRFWLEGEGMRPALRLASEMAAGGAVYLIFLALFCRKRVTRYVHFLLDLRKGSPEVTYQEIQNV